MNHLHLQVLAFSYVLSYLIPLFPMTLHEDYRVHIQATTLKLWEQPESIKLRKIY